MVFAPTVEGTPMSRNPIPLVPLARCFLLLEAALLGGGAAAPRAHAAVRPGRLVSWGSNASGVVSNTPAGEDFVAVAAGGYHSVALRANGSLVSWGEDEDGQVSQTPSGTGFVAVAAGEYHCVALRANGSLVSWGWDQYGQVSRTPAGTGYV